MYKKDLISRTTELLHLKDSRKKVRPIKTTFHISDDEGNTSDFVITKNAKSILFTTADVERILDSAFDVIIESLKNGEEVFISGFGTFNVHKRAERVVRHPDTGELVTIDAHYTTKFTPGSDLKLAAKIYELSTEEAKVETYVDKDGE